MNTEQFIIRSREKHGDLYDYSNTEYINAKTKVEIICSKHGSFFQLPGNHFRYGCKKCAGKELSKAEIMDMISEKHRNRYTYISDFSKPTDRIKILCDDHGIFETSVADHIKGRRCKKCYHQHLKSEYRLSDQEVIRKSKKAHGNKYDYSRMNYTGAANKISILCPAHGLFEQNAQSHWSGCGCPKCSMGNKSSSEVEWLNSLGVPDDKNSRNVRITVENKIYIVDGKVGSTVYEFNGDYWHGNPDKFNPEDINSNNGATFGELYKGTIERETRLREAGFKVISIWESDWKIKNSR